MCIKSIFNLRFFSRKIPTWKDTAPWIPPINGGHVIKVYDGDTITIAAKLPYRNSKLYRWSVRLSGIDTPEIKSKDEKLKNFATEARDDLRSKIMNKLIKIEKVSIEKYGRLLATVICNGENMNEYMLNKWALPYDGSTKLTEAEQIRKLGI